VEILGLPREHRISERQQAFLYRRKKQKEHWLHADANASCNILLGPGKEWIQKEREKKEEVKMGENVKGTCQCSFITHSTSDQNTQDLQD
jgi:hypothetical protein